MKLAHIKPTCLEWALLPVLVSGISLCIYCLFEFERRYPLGGPRPGWGFFLYELFITLVLVQSYIIACIGVHICIYYSLCQCLDESSPVLENECTRSCGMFNEWWSRWADRAGGWCSRLGGRIEGWCTGHVTRAVAFVLGVEPGDLEAPVGLLDEELKQGASKC